MSNPSRYLTQFPPPDLARQPGSDLNVYDSTATASPMPQDFFELRAKVVYRRGSVPYFADRSGTTSSTALLGRRPNNIQGGTVIHVSGEQLDPARSLPLLTMR